MVGYYHQDEQKACAYSKLTDIFPGKTDATLCGIQWQGYFCKGIFIGILNCIIESSHMTFPLAPSRKAIAKHTLQ
jgi:hypothetical protein